jgi:hypothetical protein
MNYYNLNIIPISLQGNKGIKTRGASFFLKLDRRKN